MATSNKTIEIKYDPRTEAVLLQTSGKPHIDEVVAMLLSALDAVSQELVRKGDDNARYTLHDRLNLMFGRLLERLVPASEIPDLTSEAIIKAENDLIKEANRRNITIEALLNEKRDKRNRKAAKQC